MTENNPNINRVCSFYASDWHLLTMLLPNIDRKINEGVKITTILENDLTEKMETLLEKVRLKNKEKILNVTWNNKEINIESIKSITKDKDEIIISGSIEFIENVHKKIKECIENNSLQKENITIIDCYDINKVQSKIKELLELHDKILNTAGEKDKEEYVLNIKTAN